MFIRLHPIIGYRLTFGRYHYSVLVSNASIPNLLGNEREVSIEMASSGFGDGVPQASLLEAVRGDVRDVKRGLEMVSRALLAAAERCAAMEERLDERQRRLDDSWRRMEERALALEANMTQRWCAKGASPEDRLVALEESVERAIKTVFPRVETLLSLVEESRAQLPSLSKESSTSSPSSAARASTSSSVSPRSPGTASSPASSTNSHRPQDDQLRDAANSGRLAEVRRLLDAGANPNTCSKSGRSALHCAVRSPVCVTLLGSRGAIIDIKDKRLETPLHIAARLGCEETAKILLTFGASSSSKNSADLTPLDVASGDEIRKLLLTFSIPTNNSRTAAPPVTSGSSLPQSNSRKSNGSSSNNPTASSSGTRSRPVDSLANASAIHPRTTHKVCPCNASHSTASSVNVPSDDNAYREKLLRRACRRGHVDKVRSLLVAGTNLHRDNLSGQQPVHIAAMYDQPECIKVLREYGATIDIRNHDGLTPLHLAAKYKCRKAMKYLFPLVSRHIATEVRERFHVEGI